MKSSKSTGLQGTDPDAILCWQEYMVKEVPISQTMGIEVVSLAPSVVLRAPLAPNQNNKNTAFAGSLSSALSLAGWIAVQRWIDSSITVYDVVLFQSETEFLRPVRGDFQVQVDLSSDANLERTVKTLDKRGKARVTAGGSVLEKDQQRVRFTGHYVVLKK